MARKNNEIDMTQGSILKNMLIMVLSIAATNILQHLFTTIDMFVVGQYGEDNALASVGACSSLISLMLDFFLGLSAGSGIVMARHFGAKNKTDGSKCVHTAICLSVAVGIILAVFAWFAAEPLLTLLDTPVEDGVFEGAKTYMRIYFLGMPFILLFNFCASLLRAVGDAKRSFIYIIQASVIHVILSVVFVAIFKLNVAGVALATILSQVYCAIRYIVCFLRYDGILKIHLKKIRIHKDVLKDMAKFGIPIGIQNSMFSVSAVFLQSSINSLGPAAMTGAVASQNIETFLFYIMGAVVTTLLNFTSQNYGANNPARIKKAAFYAMGMVAVAAAVMGALELIFAKQLLGFYNVVDADELKFGLERMWIVIPTQMLSGFSEITGALLQGIFKPLPVMIFSVGAVCGARLLWIATVFAAFPSIFVLFMSYPLSWAICFLAQGITFIYYFKKFSKRVNQLEQPIAVME